jgi:hypothetical protein
VTGGLIAADAEGVRDPVDVVEPGSDQGDLEDAAVVETYFAETVDVGTGAQCGVLREFHDVVEHGAILRREWRLGVV